MSTKVKICADWSDELLEVDLPIDRDCFKEDCNYVCIGDDSVKVVGMFDKCKAVPDVDRYRALKKGNNVCLDERGPREICRSKYKDRYANSDEHTSSTMVFLLESPHKDEYKDGCPVAPAQGDTGCNIAKYLGSLLCHLSPNISDESRVIISNPIRYQTSLSMILKSKKINTKIRDKMLDNFWGIEKIKKDFLCRIRKYKPNIIINACTGGMDSNGFRRTVSKYLQEKGICVGQLYEINHPSSWSIPEFYMPNCLPEPPANSQDTATPPSITNEDTTDAPDDNSDTAPAGA